MLGRAMVSQQRFVEALDLLQRGLAIQERVNGPSHPESRFHSQGAGQYRLRFQVIIDVAQQRFRRSISTLRIFVHGGETEHIQIGPICATGQRRRYACPLALRAPARARHTRVSSGAATCEQWAARSHRP
ncbi:MAG: tetratricopeptide repeat protein [Longimicrobiales bacterium]